MTNAEGLVSLALRAKIVRGMLVAYAAINALFIPFTWVRAFAMNALGVEPGVLAVALVIAALALVATQLGIVIMVPLWVHRARANLGAGGLRYSPAWSALSFFVPVAGLIVPFLAMRQIYNRSMGEDEYQLNAGVADVTSWWACYIGAVLVSAFLLLTALFNLNGMVFIVTPPLVSNAISIFDSLLLIGAALFLWRIVGSVTRAQQGLTNVAAAFA